MKKNSRGRPLRWRSRPPLPLTVLAAALTALAALAALADFDVIAALAALAAHALLSFAPNVVARDTHATRRQTIYTVHCAREEEGQSSSGPSEYASVHEIRAVRSVVFRSSRDGAASQGDREGGNTARVDWSGGS